MDKKRQYKKLLPRHVFMCLFAVLLALFGVTLSQKSKMEEIAKKQELLQKDYEDLLLEEERLARMVEYANTDEYLEQYVRERLGYLGPGDYKFYIDEKD